jgi:hypothetical protein
VAAGDHSGHGHGHVYGHGHDLLRGSRGVGNLGNYRPFFTMYERSSTVRQL